MTRPLYVSRQSPILVTIFPPPSHRTGLIPVLSADQLVTAIRDNNPDSMIQFYLTWGRPYGEQELCQTMQQFCTYESMQEALTERYTSFACLNKPARLAPVGDAFRSNGGVGGVVDGVSVGGGVGGGVDVDGGVNGDMFQES